MPFLLPAWTFLKGVPSWAWLALAGVLLIAGSYYKGASDKNEWWQAKLTEAAAEAERKADEARKKADENADERAAEFEQESETLEGVIRDAENAGVNPLDSLIDSLR